MRSVTRISLVLALALTAIGAPVVRADSTPPTVTAPVHRLVVGHRLGTNYMPARISWSATDFDGINGYWLQERIDNGVWRTVTLPTKTTASVVRALYSWHTYQYQVKASDLAGNSSAWAVGPAFVAIAYDNGSSAIAYSSGWFTRALSSAYGGSVRTRCYGAGIGCNSSAVGATAKLTFYGRTVGYVAPDSPFAWKINVYVDNVYQTQLDLPGTNQSRRINYVYAWATPGNHTLTVKFAPAPSPYQPNMDVDAFVVLR